ncbi:MAG: hypothetical protein EA406_09860 [Rhodospirillales bacterium]|nr:MAG: hypothetical protein EA406_09860 [Rhodospirillales bacterium]
MGGFLPVAAVSAAQLGLQVRDQRRLGKAAGAVRDRQAESEIDTIRQQQRIRDRERRQALAEALATQRARFAAGGVALEGSARSVLAGLAAEARRETADAQELANLRIGRILEESAWLRRRNLLESSASLRRGALTLTQQGLRRVPLLDR